MTTIWSVLALTGRSSSCMACAAFAQAERTKFDRFHLACADRELSPHVSL
jgi:hypothetical protein